MRGGTGTSTVFVHPHSMATDSSSVQPAYLLIAPSLESLLKSAYTTRQRRSVRIVRSPGLALPGNLRFELEAALANALGIDELPDGRPLLDECREPQAKAEANAAYCGKYREHPVSACVLQVAKNGHHP